MLDRTSQIWRYSGDVRFGLVLGRAFLLQAMHPTVGAGIAEHSSFKSDPWGRLQRSWGLALQTIYRPDGEEVGKRVREAHKHIHGIDRHGRRYHAYEPEANWWVLATGLDSAFDFATRFARPMSESDRDQALSETRELGRRFGLRDRDMSTSLAEFREWYIGIVHERLEDNVAARDVLDVLRRPPRPLGLPAVLWPPVRTLGTHLGWLTTVGTLPARARELLDLPWSRLDETRLRTIGALVRRADALPRGWRYMPTARDAFREHF